MKQPNADEIQANFDKVIEYVNTYITGDRKEKLINLYENVFGEIMLLSPASGKEHFHSAYPGGYLVHILNVTRIALQMKELWKENGGYVDYTDEEIVMSALNHDLGKLGDGVIARYVPQTNDWMKNNRGEIYTFNKDLMHMSVPDRTFFLLQKYNIPITENEFLGMKLADGLYDESNKMYYITYEDSKQLRTHLPHLIHHSDMMATRIEYEQWKKDYKKMPVQEKSYQKQVKSVKATNLIANKLKNKETDSSKFFDDLFKENK